MSTVEPPLNYRRYGPGPRFGRIPDPGGWHHPRLTTEDGALWEELPQDGVEWVHVGWVPPPRTRLGWVLHHWRHGRMMGYPRLHVLIYSITEGLGLPRVKLGKVWSRPTMDT